MGINIIVSPLEKTDIHAVLEIERQSQPEPWSEQSFLDEIGRPGSFLLAARLVKDDRGACPEPPKPCPLVAGFICFWSVADEIQILNIAVRKDLRHQGIARELLARAIETGREEKAACVNLEVRADNLPARSLYQSFGFVIVGERPNYYGMNIEPAILMELKISEQ
ncbi:MAG: GNAT family N-acetyltransferase [Syntrophobacteraceae bacterium]